MFGSSQAVLQALAENWQLPPQKNNDKVVATSRNPDSIADVQKEFGTVPRKLDINGDDDHVQSVIDDVQSSVGPIDILVNNAGYLLQGATEEFRYGSYNLAYAI